MRMGEKRNMLISQVIEESEKWFMRVHLLPCNEVWDYL